jgi:hypothetical protein
VVEGHVADERGAHLLTGRGPVRDVVSAAALDALAAVGDKLVTIS